MGAGTDRKRLVVMFESPEALSELRQRGILRESTDTQSQNPTFLPQLGAFVVAGDTHLLSIIKTGIAMVVHTLKQLYVVEMNKTQFTWEDLLAQARRIYDALDEDALRLGLFFTTELGMLGGYGMNQEGTTIVQFSINESIVTVRNPEEWLDCELARYTHKADAQQSPGFSGDFVFGSEDDSGQQFQAGFDWNLLHEEIRSIARSRFESGHFADSVEASLKAVNEKVRAIYKAERGEEKDGASLMQDVFSLKNPVLRLGDLETITGKNMQVGYLQIFAGAMTGIRNPKAHGNIEIDADRAGHFLFLASLLMHKIDEAQVVRQSLAGITALPPNTTR